MVDFDSLPKNKEKKPFGNEVKITDKKYVRYKEGAERYSMGLHTFQELAKEANAIYRVRKIVLVSLEVYAKKYGLTKTQVVLKALEKLYEEEETK